MTLDNFLRLPFGVQIGVVAMLWPAIWAAALMGIALTADFRRRTHPTLTVTRSPVVKTGEYGR
jgi:hypothetical protein